MNISLRKLFLISSSKYLFDVGREDILDTMRSAFIRWLRLHDEELRVNKNIRIPNWFRWHIRNNCNWEYHVNSNLRNYYKLDTSNQNNKRSFKGFYQFSISDEELINLKRAEWIK